MDDLKQNQSSNEKPKGNKIINFAFVDIKLHVSTNFVYLMIYNVLK